MSRRNTKSQVAVERLLDERRQYQDWIEKLAVPGAAGAPSPVVERVRADYQSRLDNVTRQLARHESELETALAEAEMRRDQAAGQRAARQEALAEAGLRHDVGEYDDEKFSGISVEHTSFLAQLSEDVESADRDITRFEEILGLIARVLPEAAPPPSVASGPSARVEPGAPAAPAVVEALGKVAARIDELDELSFLRSVAGGAPVALEAPVAPAVKPAAAAEAPAPSEPAPKTGSEPVSPQQPSRPVLSPRPPRAPKLEVPEAPEPPAAQAPAPEPEPAPPIERTAESRRGEMPLPSPVHHTVPETHEGKPAAHASRKGPLSAAEADEETARKSLRCTECQTLNLPTEWYCEKCGAELSAF